MYTQPAILLGVLALAGEVLSSSLAGEGAAARQNHARQVRMHRRRGLTGTNDTDNNPCKRASSSNASSGSTSFRVKDASNSSSRNVTAIPATSYIRQGNGEGASFSVSDSRQPLNEGSSDALSSERTSLQADTSADEGDSSSSSSSWSSSSASTTSSAAPSQSSTASTGGSGMSLATSWEGSAFESWDFFTYSDPTHGDVNYISQSDAKSQNLISVQDGMFKMAVSTGDLVNGKRNSVRISSPTYWKKGQLMVASVAHMPVGCGTWPALWSIGAKRAWPAGGEIDILEGVNNVAGNTYTLHTTDGCSMSGQSSSSSLALTEDCQYQPGCSYKDRDDASFGPDFNSAGGGFYASFMDDSGIKIWFWTASNVPDSVKNGSPVMSEFGTPKATFESSTCNMDTFFDEEQMIIINTTLMGDWAGATFWNNGCTGTLADTVSNSNNFNDAYWLINYVKIYE